MAQADTTQTSSAADQATDHLISNAVQLINEDIDVPTFINATAGDINTVASQALVESGTPVVSNETVANAIGKGAELFLLFQAKYFGNTLNQVYGGVINTLAAGVDQYLQTNTVIVPKLIDTLSVGAEETTKAYLNEVYPLLPDRVVDLAGDAAKDIAVQVLNYAVTVPEISSAIAEFTGSSSGQPAAHSMVVTQPDLGLAISAV